MAQTAPAAAPRAAVALLPAEPGVYRFRDADNRVLYLGRAANVRLAVAGLHRVMPLAYSGGRMSGSERDMARVRGVEPAARHVLVQALAAVLDRDPMTVATVREALVSRRDSAAQRLDFERAAR